MFRNHDISFQELNVIHTAMVLGQVEENIAKNMTRETVTLIE